MDIVREYDTAARSKIDEWSRQTERKRCKPSLTSMVPLTKPLVLIGACSQKRQAVRALPKHHMGQYTAKPFSGDHRALMLMCDVGQDTPQRPVTAHEPFPTSNRGGRERRRRRDRGRRDNGVVSMSPELYDPQRCPYQVNSAPDHACEDIVADLYPTAKSAVTHTRASTFCICWLAPPREERPSSAHKPAVRPSSPRPWSRCVPWISYLPRCASIDHDYSRTRRFRRRRTSGSSARNVCSARRRRAKTTTTKSSITSKRVPEKP